VAGIYGALRVLGKEVSAIKDQRVVCVGAGSAGMGVTRVIALGTPHPTLLFPSPKLWLQECPIVYRMKLHVLRSFLGNVDREWRGGERRSREQLLMFRRAVMWYQATLVAGMQKHGLSEEQARENIWVLDRCHFLIRKRTCRWP